MFLQIFGEQLQNYTASQPSRSQSTLLVPLVTETRNFVNKTQSACRSLHGYGLQFTCVTRTVNFEEQMHTEKGLTRHETDAVK
jgi:hypothetical protein